MWTLWSQVADHKDRLLLLGVHREDRHAEEAVYQDTGQHGCPLDPGALANAPTVFRFITAITAVVNLVTEECLGDADLGFNTLKHVYGAAATFANVASEDYIEASVVCVWVWLGRVNFQCHLVLSHGKETGSNRPGGAQRRQQDPFVVRELHVVEAPHGIPAHVEHAHHKEQAVRPGCTDGHGAVGATWVGRVPAEGEHHGGVGSAVEQLHRSRIVSTPLQQVVRQMGVDSDKTNSPEESEP